MPPPEPTALSEFLEDGAARIARLADPSIGDRVPSALRSTAASVARQASGGWTVTTVAGGTFTTDVSMRTMRIGAGFAVQCERVVQLVTSSVNPEIAAILGSFADPSTARQAVMSAFFHYFAAHEFVHVEQGLGSDQYRDSDFYMPVVMEADYVADVAGLAIALESDVPELAGLTRYQTSALLIAIHIAAMHGFAPSRRDDARPRKWLATWKPASGMDANTFLRLLIWYLHFARVTKAGICPAFDSPTFLRSWIIVLPRLLASDPMVTIESIAARRRRPYAAASDIVVAYHGEDGLYRIHRAAFTDVDRTQRLSVAVLQEDFDAVRTELEELLVFNPALIPVTRARNVDVEWITSGLIEALDAARSAIAGGDGHAAAIAVKGIDGGFHRLLVMLRGEASVDQQLGDLLHRGERCLADLRRELVSDAPDGALAGGMLVRLLSLVDQIAVSLD